MHSFTELEAWKRSRLLRIEISKLCKSFPPYEKYRLCDQIIRSSGSIVNNIPKGRGRFPFKEASKILLNQTEECLKLINGFINYPRQKLESPS